jgi:hypothetical protein
VLTEKGYNVELYIPYSTFGLETAPESVYILPCVSYYKSSYDRNTSQYHNQKGVSNFYTHQRDAYVEFNKYGYVSNNIKVEDIYLTSKDVVDGYYVKNLICVDEYSNDYEIKNIEEQYNNYFENIDGNYRLKVKTNELNNILNKDIKAKDLNNNEYVFNVSLLEKSTANVYIDFKNGQVINKGIGFANVAIGDTISTVKLKDKNEFIKAKPTFTNGINGDSNGAILTNYRNGAYTLIKDLDFTKDFTVSCWIFLPKGATLSEGNSSYLFGTTKTDNCENGFRLTLRKTNYGYGFNIGSSASDALLTYADTMSSESWHNVILVRDANNLLLYVDGKLQSNIVLSDDANFTSSSLCFGAYIGESWNYHNDVIAFDNIMVCEKAIDITGISIIYNNKM